MSKLSLKKLQTLTPDESVTRNTAVSVLYRKEQFGQRAYKALLSLNCVTAADILAVDPAELHALPNIGTATVAEIMAFMLRYRDLSVSSELDDNTSPFDTEKSRLTYALREHIDWLYSLNNDCYYPVRLSLDFGIDEKPRFAITPITEDVLTTALEEPKPPKKRKVLEIINPDGEVWSEEFAYLTFMRFIEDVGIDKVKALNLEAKRGIPLISSEKKGSGSKMSSNGLYIFTGIANSDKAKLVETIAKKLHLNYKAHNYSVVVE